ncbi:Exocyst complex component 1 [Chelonia mydas]|uniref:Exocyst complex component 1 n=1 Tax=Chelonia mydas TaxID=8469 RepID=M7AQL7_CHEMY|nr:Exocyst complex component 1 [Chelonia mydas]
MLNPGSRVMVQGAAGAPGMWMTTERPVQVNVVKVKKSDKGDFYKRQTAWALRDLAVVDAKDAVKENPEFDLHFDKVYKWVASSTAEKNTFISCIWKLNQRYLRKKIDFINVSAQLLEELPKVAEESVPSGENQSVTGGDEEAVDEYQELNAREEQDIEIMMEGCEYAISNAEAFAEKLSRELQVLDGANIQSIMASEKQVNILMTLLDEALKEVDQIELKLSSYEEMLQSVKEQMDQISESNHLIHLSNTNNVKLLSEIEFLVNHMDLAKGHIKALQEGDLASSRGIEACTNAADALLQCMNVALRPDSFLYAAWASAGGALRPREGQFFAFQFWSRPSLACSSNCRESLVTSCSPGLELAQLLNTEGNLQDLLRYAKLMEWLKSTDYGKYEGLTKNYMDYLSRLYEREIKDFFEVAKIKMTGTTKEGKKFGLHGSSGKLTGSTSSLNKLSVQSSGNRRSQSSSLLDMGNMSASDLDVADRTKFDKLHMWYDCLTVYNCTRKDMIRQMMIKIFRSIEPELNNLIALGDKIDSFNSLYMLVKMSHHVWTAQNVDPASFLSTTLGNVLVTVKRSFDKCISNQIKQMEEVKISKKSKVGILTFVAEFEEFAALAESIFKNAERRGDLDKAYIKLIRSVFINGFKPSDRCKRPMPISDPHSSCLHCLGEGHISEKCKICKSYKPRTVKECDTRLRALLMALTLTPTPEQRSDSAPSTVTSGKPTFGLPRFPLHHSPVPAPPYLILGHGQRGLRCSSLTTGRRPLEACTNRQKYHSRDRSRDQWYHSLDRHRSPRRASPCAGASTPSPSSPSTARQVRDVDRWLQAVMDPSSTTGPYDPALDRTPGGVTSNGWDRATSLLRPGHLGVTAQDPALVQMEKVANESQKTPRDVVMMENFHHIFATLSRLKISCLEAEKKEAKQKYTDHLQSYVIYSLGQPLEKLNHFFEGVEARVAQGIREEEVSYQLAFNKQELRKVIKEYPGKEVKKGLDNLYKKVDKHLCEEENLLQVVWHSMQDEFIRQYKHFEGLIARCYPGSGVTMEFTIQDILDYCSSIAQSH